MEVYINGKRIKINTSQAIAKGGEADIFNIGNDKVLKLYKQPNHPDYQNFLTEQQAAQERLDTHQQKLRQFPKNLPSQVIQPEDLATNKSGKEILGYTMPFLKNAVPLIKYSDRAFRTSAGISSQTIIDIFRSLHQIISQLHLLNVVIGDFNDLNILIQPQANSNQPYLIDADSFQFGSFLCRVFTTRFVDPLLCDRAASKLVLDRPHNFNSDWYAFTVMLMQCLLYVDPYGGVYKPKNLQDKIPHESRPLKRITIFHPEVKYPKPAIPYNFLQDDLLQFFHLCFEKDCRGKFSLALLDRLQWTNCLICGIEHSRSVCPMCSLANIKSKSIPSTISHSTVKTDLIFSTNGIILSASIQSGQLCWLYHEPRQFKREGDRTVLSGELDSQLRFWLNKQETLIGKQGQVITLDSAQSSNRLLAVDSYGISAMCAVNNSSRYWLWNGQLMRDGKLGAEYIGDVLFGQTQFWVGETFGFGFYHAGNIKVAFIFDAQRSGINDSVKLSAWQGQLIDATCSFSRDRCWFFTSTQEQGKIIHRVHVIQKDGTVIATAEAAKQDGSTWLDSIHGKCAIDDFLLSATDEGIIRLGIDKRQIIKTKEFPETELFVNTNSHLYASSQGLYAVSQQQIQLLTIT